MDNDDSNDMKDEPSPQLQMTLQQVPVETERSSNTSAADVEKQSEIAVMPLKTHGPVLRIIAIQYGLLDDLVSAGVLDQEQVEIVEKQSSGSDKVNKLMDVVNELSPEVQAQFWKVVGENQPYVLNYLRNNGKRSITDQDNNWPLYGSHHWQGIQQNLRQLKNVIDTDNGLLDELISVQCINERQFQSITQFKDSVQRNTKLLDIIQRGSVRDYDQLIECLLKTKQQQAVFLFDPKRSSSRPLGTEELSRLTVNHAFFVDMIDVTNGLSNSLYSDDGITRQQKEFIESAETQSESVRRLLSIVKRGSQSDFVKFIKALNATGQGHLADRLLEDGVIAEIIAETDLNVAEENIVVKEFFKYIVHSATPQHRLQLTQKLNQLVGASHGNQLVAMQPQHSIKLFIVCKSLSGMQYLSKFHSTEQMKIIVEQLFAALLNQPRDVTVNKLVWNMSDFNNCAQHVYKASKLRVFLRIYELASGLPDGATSSSGQSISRLHHELIEILLLKAAGQLFAVVNKLTADADVVALTTLCAVSYNWYNSLFYRQCNKRKLRHYFRHVCLPYRINPQKKVTSPCTVSGNVQGVVQISGKLYIVSGNTITVSAVDAPHRQLKEIKVTDLSFARDLAVCSETTNLYISDFNTRCIRVVELSSNYSDQIKERVITTQYVPWTLSVRCKRLCVTPFQGNTLYLYSDCDIVASISLPHKMTAHHSVETSRGTFVVSHWAKRLDSTSHAIISELSVDGQILNVHKGPSQFNQSQYLSIGADDCLLVADMSKKCILHLDSNLNLKRVVLDCFSFQSTPGHTGDRKLHGQPFRLHYDEKTGTLAVSYYGSSNVDLFAVGSC